MDLNRSIRQCVNVMNGTCVVPDFWLICICLSLTRSLLAVRERSTRSYFWGMTGKHSHFKRNWLLIWHVWFWFRWCWYWYNFWRFRQPWWWVCGFFSRVMMMNQWLLYTPFVRLYMTLYPFHTNLGKVLVFLFYPFCYFLVLLIYFRSLLLSLFSQTLLIPIFVCLNDSI